MCALNFTTKAYLDKHFTHNHGDRDMNERSHKCTQCARTFTFAHNLRAHVRYVHDGVKGAHVCATCQAAFRSPSKLAAHIRTHLGARRYKCVECDGTAFAQQSQLDMHTRARHTHVRPYKCADCDGAFTGSGQLRRHMHTVHMGKRAYACIVCDWRYATANKLRNHQRNVHRMTV